MKVRFKNILSVSKTSFKQWMSRDPFRESPSIAYHAIFSLPGLLVVIITLAGYFFGREAVNDRISIQISGVFLTALLFEIGKFGLGIYFANANPGTGYGAAGSVILIMLWVSYSTMIVLYGAEFTHTYAIQLSGKVAPTEVAKKKVPNKKTNERNI